MSPSSKGFRTVRSQRKNVGSNPAGDNLFHLFGSSEFKSPPKPSEEPFSIFWRVEAKL